MFINNSQENKHSFPTRPPTEVLQMWSRVGQKKYNLKTLNQIIQMILWLENGKYIEISLTVPIKSHLWNGDIILQIEKCQPGNGRIPVSRYNLAQQEPLLPKTNPVTTIWGRAPLGQSQEPPPGWIHSLAGWHLAIWQVFYMQKVKLWVNLPRV